MHLVDIVYPALVVFGGAVVQTVVGFGMGLFAIPLLLFAGSTLPDAVALTVGAASVQLLVGLRQVHRQVVWREALGLAAIQSATVPLGMIGMQLLASAGPARVKQAVGAFLLVALVVRQLAHPAPREHLHGAFGPLAAALGGLLGGLVGMGGPPLVLYALAHRWTVDRFRAFLWSQFALTIPIMLVSLGYRFGWGVLRPFGFGLALTPCLWLGAHVGLRLTARWEPSAVQRAALALLYALAVSSLAGPALFA